MTTKTVGPSELDIKMGIVERGVDTPRWDVDMSHWTFLEVDPPLIKNLNGSIKPKRFQLKVLEVRSWNNPRVFFNSGYKCAAGSPVVCGEIDNVGERKHTKG